MITRQVRAQRDEIVLMIALNVFEKHLFIFSRS